VLTVLPGDVPEAQAFVCDRELVEVGGRWVLQAMAAAASAGGGSTALSAPSSTAPPSRPAPAAAIEHSR